VRREFSQLSIEISWIDICLTPFDYNIAIVVCVKAIHRVDVVTPILSIWRNLAYLCMPLIVLEKKAKLNAPKLFAFDRIEEASRAWIQEEKEFGNLFSTHSNLNATFLSHPTNKKTQVILLVNRKDFIPYGEEKFPKAIRGVQAKVVSGQSINLSAAYSHSVFRDNGGKLFPGMSIGPPESTSRKVLAGTLGGFVCNDTPYALTCHHVATAHGLYPPRVLHAPDPGDYSSFPAKHLLNIAKDELTYAKGAYGHKLMVPVENLQIEVSIDTALLTYTLPIETSTKGANDSEEYYQQSTESISLSTILSGTIDKMQFFGRSSGCVENLNFASLIHTKPPGLFNGSRDGLWNVENQKSYHDEAIVMLNQILLYPDNPNDTACLPGDSGSLLSKLDQNELKAVGLVTTTLDAGAYVVATPIEAILNYDKLKFFTQ
jgi:hypothetical protein